MPVNRNMTRSRRVTAAVVGALVVVVATGASCNSGTDAPTAAPSSGPGVAGFSFTLQPSSVSVSPGGSALTIGTIRGASGLALSFVVGVPNGVSVRVTSDTAGDGVTTKKFIFFADAATVPGTYALAVRVIASGRPETEAPLTLVVAGGQ